MKILIIEDNKELANSVEQYLNIEGYRCEVCYTSRAGTEKLVSYQYDIIILDIMLPDGSGLDLIDLIKSEKIEGGLLIISAKNSFDDKIIGLEKGADDYITKPFHMGELHARIKAIYRRKNLIGDKAITFREIVLDTERIEVRISGTVLPLTRKEFDLLLYMLVNKNRVLSHQAIAEHLWGNLSDNLTNFDYVYQHVKNLRRKITIAGGKDYLSTVYGIGYKLNED